MQRGPCRLLGARPRWALGGAHACSELQPPMSPQHARPLSLNKHGRDDPASMQRGGSGAALWAGLPGLAGCPEGHWLRPLGLGHRRLPHPPFLRGQGSGGFLPV